MSGQAFTKHRKQEDTWTSDFSDALPSGESIQSVDAVQVVKHGTGSWEDVSSEFGALSGTADGSGGVQFTLTEAGQADHQDPPEHYVVFIQVTTGNSRKLVNTHRLRITGEGDTNL